MRGNKGWIKVLLIALVVALLTGAIQYFLWNNKMKTTTMSYEKQITDLQATLDAVGETVEAFTVINPVTAGDEIVQTNLKPVSIPESFVGGSYVLDPSEFVGKYYKISVKPGTPLTSDLLMEEKIDDTVREKDIVSMTWPVGMKVGDYIDFEITYPMGEKFTVLARKRVLAINNETIKVHLSGVERHLYSGALVDYFLNSKDGATIDMVKYVEPGVQKAALVYYAVPKNIISIITADPNIIQKVETAVNAQRRSMIDSALKAVTPEKGSSIASGRNNVTSKTTQADETFKQSEKERLEKEAQDAAAAAGAAEAQKLQQQQQQQQENKDGLKTNGGVVD